MSNTENTYSGFWAIVLLGAAMIVFLGSQIIATAATGSALRKSLDNARELASQAEQVDASVRRIEKLITDVAQLAQTDDTARQLIQKYARFLARKSDSATGDTPAPETPEQ
jgi:hypothetical protein